MSGFKIIEGDVTLRDSTGAEKAVPANPLRTDPTGTTAQPVTDNGGSLTVDGTVTANAGTGPWPVTDNGGSLTVDGPLTDTELRASPVPVSGPLTDTQLRATAVPVSDGGGSLTVDGPLTDTQLRATAVPISAASLPLPAGAATAALQTQPGVDIGDVTVNNAAGASAVNVQDGGNSLTVDDGGGSLTVDGPLTDAQLRATAVPISASALPLPTNAATETTLAAINTKTAALGQSNMAGSSPVVIASNQSAVPVSHAAASQADGHSATLGATTDSAAGQTVIGRLKAAVNALAGGLPAALVGGRLDSNIGAWLGSTAPTIGQKAMASSVPVALASDQTAVAVSQAPNEEQTFTAIATSVAIGNNKSMISVYNPSASTKVLKIREIYIRNAQTSAVTGVVSSFSVFRFVTGTTPTGGTALTAVRHDTNDALGAGIGLQTGATIAGEEAVPFDLMRQSSDEWGVGTSDVESTQVATSNYMPFRAKRDPIQKPITLRAGQGFHIKHTVNSTAGAFDIVIIFTQV